MASPGLDSSPSQAPARSTSGSVSGPSTASPCSTALAEVGPGAPFRPLRVEDGPELLAFFERHPQPLSGYTFAMLMAWDPVFHYQWNRPEPETLIVSCLVEPDPCRHLLQPVGSFSPAVQRALLAEVARLSYAVRLYGVSARFLETFPEFVARFEVVEERGAGNYLYSAQDLAELAGRKYAAKRNHIAQGSREYAWTADPLRGEDAVEACALARRLFEESDRSPSLERDVRACEVALRHFDLLRLKGTAIRVEGRLEAFSVWEKLDPKTAVVHFERAQRARKGLYQVVNQEAAKVMRSEGIERINREEDLGDEGLRKAKLSYHPVHFEKSFTLTHKG